MKQASISLLMLILLVSCQNDQNQRADRSEEEIVFNIDSSYFDFSVIDTFHGMYMPRIDSFMVVPIKTKALESDSYLLSKEDSSVAIIFSKHQREGSSLKHYQALSLDDNLEGQVLDISSYVKNGQKLVQLMIKNENQTIFKIIHDGDNVAQEMDIYIANDAYVEKNIKFAESLIGLIHFSKL